jgi:threonine dehydratase
VTDIGRDEIAAARTVVARIQAPTPTLRWPLLDARLGARAWVKHENHTRVGAFKVRGGAVYIDALRRREPHVRGVVSATRGNHGQSIALSAGLHGLTATIVVPHGNSREKNAAMRALGAELIEHGDDFQAASSHAAALAEAHGLHRIPSFHRDLVCGVASYWMEFFEQAQPEVVFVPIGLGSGIAACAAARAVTGVRTRIVGVVSAHATAMADSFVARRVVEAPSTTLLADGLACRLPVAEALEIVLREVDEIVKVSDAEIGSAMRALFASTHNVAEGAGAASLAAALQQRGRWRGREIGLPLTGGNVDSSVFASVLAAAD